MHEHKQCPECESLATTVQHTEFFADMVERVRTCDDCPTQWTVSYADPIVKEVQNFD